MAKKQKSAKTQGQGRKKKRFDNSLKRVEIKRPIQEDKKNKMVKFRNSIHRRVKIMAAEEGKQISDMVEELLTTSRKLK